MSRKIDVTQQHVRARYVMRIFASQDFDPLLSSPPWRIKAVF